MKYSIIAPDGEIRCSSDIPYLGYTYEILKGMESAGYRLLCDGRQIKFPTAARFMQAAK